MGTTSQKLTYLNTTKQDIKQAINNLGGDITSSTTFRNYATELNDIYDNLPKVSDTGTNVSLSPTLKGRLGIVSKGNTLQDGTPTPSTPVEIQSATGTQTITISGNNVTSVEKTVNLGNIKLNKIGNYEDYIDGTPDNWVLYKNIGKVVFDGSSDESWSTYSNSGVTNKRFITTISDIIEQNSSDVLCNRFQKGLSNVNDNFIQTFSSKYVWLGSTQIENLDLAQFKTWLSTNNTEVSYILAETQQTPITDTNLISQLNELYYLQSYNDTTNIDVTGNLPMRVTASAISIESEKQLQTKSVTVTQNGTTTINPDTGYDGMTSVSLTTNVSPNLQTKSVTITENTTTTITPTTGKDGLSSVSVITNVGGGEDLSEYFLDEIGGGSSDVSGLVRIIKKIPDDIEIGNYNTLSYCCNGASALTYFPNVTVPSQITKMEYMFQYCENLENAPYLNTENITTMRNMYAYCYKLKNVPVYDTSHVTTMINMFLNCTLLTDESLNNILLMCANATSYTGTKTLLRVLGGTNYSASHIQTLSNYQNFVSAGWTIGY